jgi:hypothetical protein
MVRATPKQVVNGAVARCLRDLYWSLCSCESWATNQLGTFCSKLRGVELVAGSVRDWAGHCGSELQEILKYLVENRPESWMYVICWQLSSTPTGSDMWVFVSLNTHFFSHHLLQAHILFPNSLACTISIIQQSSSSLSNDFCCMLLCVILDFSK